MSKNTPSCCPVASGTAERRFCQLLSRRCGVVAYSASYEPSAMREAKSKVADLLDEELGDNAPISLRESLRQKQKDAQQRELPQKKAKDWER